MSNDDTRSTVHAYYNAWATRDRETVVSLLHPELRFRAKTDDYRTAGDFLSCCWKYSEGLSAVRFVEEIYDGDRAFVILEWSTESGKTFAGAEFVTVRDNRLASILVVNNDPAFKELLA